MHEAMCKVFDDDGVDPTGRNYIETILGFSYRDVPFENDETDKKIILLEYDNT